MTDLLSLVIMILGWVFLAYWATVNTGFLFLTGLAGYDFTRYLRRTEFAAYDESFADPRTRSVSVLVPAYNESAGIIDTVRAMTSLRYPDFEIVVIDDGSTDGTAERLIAAFGLVEAPLVLSDAVETVGAARATYVSGDGSHTVVLVRKDNGGKADALNVGLNVARGDLVCMVDADSILEPDALLHVARPFADDPARVVASGGVVRIANGSTVRQGRVVDVRMPRGWLSRTQVVEYLRAFMIGRSGWSAMGGLLIISGAFGLFRRDILIQLGGLDRQCLGEDAELVVRLHRWLRDTRTEGRVVFVPEPVAWTEAPYTRQVLRSQRRRWHRGLTEILTKHRGMVGRPRYGVVGMVAMPWFVLFELVAPAVELAGLVYLTVLVGLLGAEHAGWVDPTLVDGGFVGLLLAVAVGYSVLITWMSLLTEEVSFHRYRGFADLGIALWAAVEENLGYRQLNALWRTQGSWEALRRTAPEWGDMRRRGFGRA